MLPNYRLHTDRFLTRGEHTPTGEYDIDALCAALEIEHRLTRPRRPQTNGMVERFNGRISEIIVTLNSTEDLVSTFHRYVRQPPPASKGVGARPAHRSLEEVVC